MRAWLLETGRLYRSGWYLVLFADPYPPPDLPTSSENMGAASGEESKAPRGWKRSEALDEVSESVALLDAGRLRFSSTSIRGSMVSML